MTSYIEEAFSRLLFDEKLEINVSALKRKVKENTAKRKERHPDNVNTEYLAKKEAVDEVLKDIEEELWKELNS